MNGLIARHTEYMTETISADLLDSFTSFIDARPRTVETYQKALRQFFRYMADNDIKKPSRDDVLNYRELLRTSGYKPGTITTYIISLRQFFKWTEAAGLYPDIAANVKGAKIERSHKKDPLTSTQAKAVFTGIDRDTLAGVRDYAILAVMTTGGLRTIEIIRANIDDMRTLGNETVLYIQGKGRDEKSEYIKLSTTAEKAIRAYLTKRGRTSGNAPLFASISNNSKGERMTTRSISRIVKDRLIDAGLNSERLTAHSLRHTAATLNLLNGGTIDETQQLLRHSNINTTMIYLHHLDRAKNNSEERISEAIF